MQYTKPEKLSIRSHPSLSERWVQEIIAEDPSILGLGDLVVRDKERSQPRAGRLDLLLQDSEKRRYEVEIQLGSTDEAHVIRTIEYWDIERKRYPQYDHCAVIVAEDITSRFLNVISLFNGTIPLIAIQMQAIKVGESVSLLFTTVLNELVRGQIDEDEDAEAAPATRDYWEARGSKATVGIVEEINQLIKRSDPNVDLKFNRFYIGLTKDRQPYNIITMRPRKSTTNVEFRIPLSDHVDQLIATTGIDTLDYDTRWSRYRLVLKKGDVERFKQLLEELVQLAFQNAASTR